MLRELQRKEKEKTRTLQSLDDDFIDGLSDYIKKRKRNYLRAQQSVDSYYEEIVADKLREIQRAEEVIKEIFKQRDWKIIRIAYIDGATGSKNRSIKNMLSIEYDLYKEIREIVERYIIKRRKLIFGEKEEIREASEKQISNKSEKKPQPIHIVTDKEKILKTEPDITTQDRNRVSGENSIPRKKIKFLNDIPAIVGIDGQIYGPFKKEDIAELPLRTCEILIKKRKAIGVD